MTEQINKQIARYHRYHKQLLKIANAIETTINSAIQADLKNSQQKRQYYRGGILVYSRVKSEESIRDRLKDRHSTLESFPDLIGCRIVVVQRAEIQDIQNLFSHQFEDCGAWDPIDYFEGTGRGRGYSGLSLDEIPIADWVSKHANPRQARPRIPKDLKWELQVHTAMEEAWSRYSHAGFYKSTRGIPSELQQRMYQLSAAARLIDDSLRQTSLEVQARQDEIIDNFAATRTDEAQSKIAGLNLDECVLFGCQVSNSSYQHLYDDLRDIGRSAGFRKSEYEPNLRVKVGDETVVALEICQRAEINKFGHFERLLRLFSRHKEELGEILGACFPQSIAIDVKRALFDRPLVIFAILILFNIEDYPRVYEIWHPLRDFIKENRLNYRDKAGPLADTIRLEINLKKANTANVNP